MRLCLVTVASGIKQATLEGFPAHLVSDNQVTVACATLEKLCQISLLPLRTEQHHNTSSEINEINLLNLN
jgi:hypothetical protein